MLRATDITCTVGGAVLIDGVDFDVVPGEIHAILGPNGAGKSTLLQCLAGIAAATDGCVVMNDQPVHRTTPADLARSRAVLSQETSVFGNYTCADVVSIGRTCYLEPSEGCSRYVREAMRLTGVEHLSNSTVILCSYRSTYVN